MSYDIEHNACWGVWIGYPPYPMNSFMGHGAGQVRDSCGAAALVQSPTGTLEPSRGLLKKWKGIHPPWSVTWYPPAFRGPKDELPGCGQGERGHPDSLYETVSFISKKNAKHEGWLYIIAMLCGRIVFKIVFQMLFH